MLNYPELGQTRKNHLLKNMDKSAAVLFHNAKYQQQQRWRFSSLFAEGFQAYIFNHAEQPPWGDRLSACWSWIFMKPSQLINSRSAVEIFKRIQLIGKEFEHCFKKQGIKVWVPWAERAATPSSFSAMTLEGWAEPKRWESTPFHHLFWNKKQTNKKQP